MTNQLLLICSIKIGGDLAQVLRNFKSFTAKKLMDAVIINKQESRKEWILNVFEQPGKMTSSNQRFQCWQHETPQRYGIWLCATTKEGIIYITTLWFRVLLQRLIFGSFRVPMNILVGVKGLLELAMPD